MRLRFHTKDDTYQLSRYMIILEILSTNRNLKEKLKEVEEMLRDIKLEELPSYQLVKEKGIEKGIEQGIEKGIFALHKIGQSYENIANMMDISVEKVKDIIHKINK